MDSEILFTKKKLHIYERWTHLRIVLCKIFMVLLRYYHIISAIVHVQSCVYGYRHTYKAACPIVGSCYLDTWYKKCNSNKR